MSARAKNIAFALAGLLIVAIVTVPLAELAIRLFLAERFPMYYNLDERNLAYRHDRELGWFPVPNTERYIERPRPITARHNGMGFRDIERGPKSKPRIAVLGDSFVWGYEVGADERLTERLQESMPEWEILNMGVSGYGTDQEYLLIRKYFDIVRPDIVVLVVYSNDFDDNSSNMRYGGYFKPYFTTSPDGGLELHGVPVPYSVNYYYGKYPKSFERLYLVRALARVYENVFEPPVVEVRPDPTHRLVLAMRDYAKSRGAVFVLAIADELSEELIPTARMAGIKHVNLKNDHRFDTDGRHWRPEGHREAARKLHEYLMADVLKPRG